MQPRGRTGCNVQVGNANAIAMPPVPRWPMVQKRRNIHTADKQVRRQRMPQVQQIEPGPGT
eukprot:7362750-Lingulodinium_polyedra.AAC.1